MGLFDRWRRKQQKERKKPTLVEPAKAFATEMAPKAEGEVESLVAEYERLVKRRAELQVERGQLIQRLDNEEMEAKEFRSLLMGKIQEAAQVADDLKTTAAKLTELGYRGVLH